jgi:hypothetical protein
MQLRKHIRIFLYFVYLIMPCVMESVSLQKVDKPEAYDIQV